MKVKRITKKPVRASKRVATRAQRPSTKRIVAEDEIIEDDLVEDEVIDDVEGEGEAIVEPEATDLLFEAEDVAEFVVEVTGEEVEVAIDDEADTVVFTVGEEEFTVEPEGDEEIVESATKRTSGKRAVKASKRIPARRRTIRR